VKVVEEFFRELDREWKPGQEGRITLFIIGSGALFLQTDYDRGTKDSDILETPEISDDVSKRLRALAGRGSPLFKKYRVFLDIVRAPIPFLPQKPIFHPVPGFKNLKNFEVKVLDIVDVVVSKLKPFRPNDKKDIEFLANKKLLPHARLLERFRLVLDYHSMDARAGDFPKFIENLNTVEREMLFVPESKIELPDWI
jgi:hypothetical protein